MKTISKFGKRKLSLVAALVCMIVAGSVSALAVPNDAIFVNVSDRIVSGVCCFSWDETVKVTEPAQVTPVVVTWNANFTTGGIHLVGLSVNGGACTAYGPRTMENHADWSVRTTRLFAWVIKPSDGLVQGTNTFTLCGGASPSTPTSGLILGTRTLAVEIGK